MHPSIVQEMAAQHSGDLRKQAAAVARARQARQTRRAAARGR